MKSLLVDALRQKDEGQDSDSLSDSGSFATQRADLAANAVDGADNSEVSGDLELMATELVRSERRRLLLARP